MGSISGRGAAICHQKSAGLQILDKKSLDKKQHSICLSATTPIWFLKDQSASYSKS